MDRNLPSESGPSPTSPVERSASSPPFAPARAPAVPVAVALMLGVFIDDWRSATLSTLLALACAAALGLGLAIFLNSRRLTSLLLLTFVSVLGSAMHHAHQSTAAVNDISTSVSDVGKLVRIEGVLVEEPWIRTTDKNGTNTPWAQFDQTVGILECSRLHHLQGTDTVSGRLRFGITGHVLHAHAGDRVSIVGWLSCPQPPDNPGEFDMQKYLARQGVRAVLYANHPAAVEVIETAGEGFSLRRKLADGRRLGAYRIAQHLSRETAPIAAALLLGVRSSIRDDVRTAFVESGAMHLLAISGLHVGILAAFVLIAARLLCVAPRTQFCMLTAAVTAYLLIAESRPPIVRATILITIAAAGILQHRRVSMLNVLAIAAIAVLAWNPAALFDVGAQLSFLAVLGILWAESWQRRRELRRRNDPFAGTVEARDGWRAAWDWLQRRIGDSSRMMLGIWLFTLPLVLANFHVFSPAGFVANLLLMPLVFLVMGFGFAFLACAFLLPQIAFLPAAPFDWGLRGLLWIVDAAASVRLGHWYVPAPSLWWLAGYFGLLAVLMALEFHATWRRRCSACLAVWILLGLGWGLAETTEPELQVTFLDVGHGCSVLVEFPNGATLLYDAGSLQSAKRAGRAVQSVLWHRGRTALDAILVSHADIDHFNAVPELMRTIPVGKLVLSQACLDFEQAGIVELCTAARERHVSIGLVQAADRLVIDPEASIDVLHPIPGEFDDDDNANSVVLRLRMANRTILLTGDLEGPGLSKLLERPSQPVDILLSPHHGSPGANPGALAEWAHPAFVVVSGGDRKSLPVLRKVYGPDTRVMSTYESGAVTFRIARDGTMSVRPYRERADESQPPKPLFP